MCSEEGRCDLVTELEKRLEEVKVHPFNEGLKKVDLNSLRRRVLKIVTTERQERRMGETKT